MKSAILLLQAFLQVQIYSIKEIRVYFNVFLVNLIKCIDNVRNVTVEVWPNIGPNEDGLG